MKHIDKIIKESLKRLIGEANEDVIQPSTAWMQQKYNEFNSSIFDNQLPRCQFAVSSLQDNVLGSFSMSKAALGRTMLGIGVPLYCQNDQYTRINKDTFYSLLKPKITLNVKYARSESDMENTLIHEMCHYYTCFDENGEARMIDRENNCHGNDFIQAAQLVSERTSGQVTIKELEDSERMDTITATQEYNKKGYGVFTFPFHGQDVFILTKDTSLVDDYKNIFKGEWKWTQNPTLIMLLKRYRYETTTQRTFMSRKLMNAYGVESLPPQIEQVFNESEWNNY